MKRYVVRRLLMAIPLLLAISFVCFCFINLIPSNPAEVALRVQQTPVITDEIIAAMEEQLGLNKPFFVRYFDWVLGCLHGDFGISYVNPKRTVAGELLRCLPATLQLAGTSFVIVAVLSIPIGFLCAVYKDGWFDKIMRGLVFVTTAMPAYWVGLLLMWGIGVQLNWLPTNGNGTWRHLILPSFTVALSYISTYIRLIRNNMLENMKQDYVLLRQCTRITTEVDSGQAHSEKLHAHLHRGDGHEHPAADLRHHRGRKCFFVAGTWYALHQFHLQSGLSGYPDLCFADRGTVCPVQSAV